MEKIYVIALITTVLFCLAKIIEMKFLANRDFGGGGSGGDDDDERSDFSSSAASLPQKPLKHLLRDALILFLSCLFACYVNFHVDTNMTDLFHVLTETKTVPVSGNSEIFVGQPEF